MLQPLEVIGWLVQLMKFSPVQPTEDIDAEPLVGVAVADAHAISQVAGRVVQAVDAHLSVIDHAGDGTWHTISVSLSYPPARLT